MNWYHWVVSFLLLALGSSWQLQKNFYVKLPVVRRQSKQELFYTPPEVGPEIYIGAVAGVTPFIWATYKFANRIRIQQQCQVCKGSGLVKETRNGKVLDRYRKCWNCGGFLPWLGWKMFFLSSIREIGNGGPLQQPTKDFEQINEQWKHQRQETVDKDEGSINEELHTLSFQI